MKAIEFEGQNIIIAEHQEQYRNLPALVEDDTVYTCWKLDWWERLVVLFTGRVWKSQLTFGQPLQPMNAYATEPIRVKRSRENDKD